MYAAGGSCLAPRAGGEGPLDGAVDQFEACDQLGVDPDDSCHVSAEPWLEEVLDVGGLGGVFYLAGYAGRDDAPADS